MNGVRPRQNAGWWSATIFGLGAAAAAAGPVTGEASICGAPPRTQAAAAMEVEVEARSGPATPENHHRIVCRFHVIRRADGSGGFDESRIPRFMEDLNYGYRDTPFVFVREPGVVHVDNNTYYANFPTFGSMVPLLNTYYTPGVVNLFITPTIQGGQFPASSWVGPPFTSGERGILFAYAAVGVPTNIATPPHEMGHVFDLLHPFDTFLGVECASGANCAVAGDLVCDTPSSPIVSFLNTTATGIYFGNEPGPCLGDPPYAPDPRLYMDAGWPAGHILRDRFSPGQGQRMVQVLNSLQPDLVGPQRPAVLVDCDSDGLDDVNQILAGLVADENRDLTPDACQVLPQAGDLLVCGMTNSPQNAPRFYDGMSGAIRGTLWNGMAWAHQLRLGPDGLVYMPTLTVIQRLDLSTGRTVDNFIDGVLEGVSVFSDLLWDPAGDILALDVGVGHLRRFDGQTGAHLGLVLNIRSRGMMQPIAMEYGPDGAIHVVGVGSNFVMRVDPETGSQLPTRVSGGALISGQGITFRDGLMYVANNDILGGPNVLRFDGASGAFLGAFVTSAGNGGMVQPHAPRFGPDGDLYVAARGNHAIERFDGASGAYLGGFVAAGAGGLDNPSGLLFVPGPPDLPCPADADGNDTVDLDDLLIVLANFGTPDGAGLSDGDLDDDGDVDLDDLLFLLARFGLSCAPGGTHT